MHFVDRHREKIRQSPMSSRLLWACLLLVVLLVLTFGAALFLFASLHNTKKGHQPQSADPVFGVPERYGALF